jgi:hypothetical protein
VSGPESFGSFFHLTVLVVNRNSSSHIKHAVSDSDDRNSYLNQQTSQQEPFLPSICQCFALTDEQCRPAAVPRTLPRQDSVTSHGSLNSEISRSYREEQAVHSSKIQGDSNRPGYLSYCDMILQRSANKDILRNLLNKENLPPSEGAPSGIDTNPQHGNHEFISVVLTVDGCVKPNEVVAGKDAAKYPWWKDKAAKTPVRKPIVASSSGKDAVDSSTLGPLPEVPSQPAPSPLAGADPSISSLRGCEINQERSQHWKPDERVATTHDGHSPMPETHWQRGSTMRNDRNHLQAFGLAVNPIKVAGANAQEAPPKRKRESGNIEVQVNDCAAKEAAQKRARSAPRSPPPVRDKGVQFVAHEHCPVMRGGSIAPTNRNGSTSGWEFGVESSSLSSLPTLAKLALDMTRDCNRKNEEGNSIVGMANQVA